MTTDQTWDAIIEDAAFSDAWTIAYRNRDFGDEDDAFRPFTKAESDLFWAMVNGDIVEEAVVRDVYDNEEDGS